MRPKRVREIELYFNYIGFEAVDWIILTQLSRASMNTVRKYEFCERHEIFD